MSAIDFAKAHPLGIGIAVVVVVGGVLLVSNMGGGGASTATAGYTTTPSGGGGDASAGQALQVAQLQATAQANQTDASKAVAFDNNATAIAIAQIQGQIAGQGLTVQQTLGSMQIQSDQAVSINNSTLQAGVQNAQIKAQEEAQKEAYGTINQQTAALVQEAKIAKQPSGLFGWIFGS